MEQYKKQIEHAYAMMTAEKYKQHIEQAYEDATEYRSKINQEIIAIQGMSGVLTRHFYNNLMSMEDVRYLEIGSWKGSTACSAMCGNNGTIVCIDNWSEWGGPKEEFLQNFEKHRGQNKATFIEMDCFDVDISQLPKFNIYLYDGNHSNESHYRALTHYYDCLDDVFIYIVDDWNVREIRDGTKRSIKDKGLKVLYEKEIRMTWDNSHTPFDVAGKYWWNGIYVAILQKQKPS
jgi:hypothetical protein